mmetsp:Transcript_3367/g.11157  ORF Transcript_3367/g.11157 Transcript_3367/m.11157 type:complete len:230 (-) Transcript_3367:287-976(-)
MCAGRTRCHQPEPQPGHTQSHTHATMIGRCLRPQPATRPSARPRPCPGTRWSPRRAPRRRPPRRGCPRRTAPRLPDQEVHTPARSPARAQDGRAPRGSGGARSPGAGGARRAGRRPPPPLTGPPRPWRAPRQVEGHVGQLLLDVAHELALRSGRGGVPRASRGEEGGEVLGEAAAAHVCEERGVREWVPLVHGAGPRAVLTDVQDEPRAQAVSGESERRPRSRAHRGRR